MEINLLGKQIYIRKGLIVVIVLALAIALGTAGYFIKNAGGQIIIGKEETKNNVVKAERTVVSYTQSGKTQKTEEAANSIIEEIKVHVAGCVNKPGVVTLKKGQIIDDAIKAAGGVTKEADMENINLAYELTENTKLKILSKKESQELLQSGLTEVSEQNRKPAVKTKSGVKIVKDSGGVVADNKENNVQQPVQKVKININTATASELDSLPGVGEKTAKDIISYREKKGKFNKIEDIMNVPRIGQSRFAQMKELITVQ